MDNEQHVRDLYDAFNTRDIDAAVAAMTEDVDWPNGWEGGRVHGHQAVRSYWTRQWAEVDSWVEAITVTTDSDGRVVIVAHQIVRDLNGHTLNDEDVQHIYEFRDGLITRMDIEVSGGE